MVCSPILWLRYTIHESFASFRDLLASTHWISQCLWVRIHPSILPSFLPSSLLSSLPSFLPPSLPSFLHIFSRSCLRLQENTKPAILNPRQLKGLIARQYQAMRLGVEVLCNVHPPQWNVPQMSPDSFGCHLASLEDWQMHLQVKAPSSMLHYHASTPTACWALCWLVAWVSKRMRLSCLPEDLIVYLGK